MNNYVLKITKKSFADKNDTNKQIVYYDLSVEIDGVKIGLSFKDNDKKIANYLLGQKQYDENGRLLGDK